MVVDARRRLLLRGRVARAGARTVPTPLRPPWALDEDRFARACTRCNACVAACSQRLITVGDGGYPEVRFDERGCTFCGDCVSTCAPAALHRAPGAIPWDQVARIGDACLAQRRVECRICGDACQPGAIRFVPKRGGVAQPTIDDKNCTGCGDCVAPCPVMAIAVVGTAAHARQG